MNKFASTVKRIQELNEREKNLWDDLVSNNDTLKRAFLAREFASAVDRVYPYVYVTVFYQSGRPVAFFPFQYKSSFHRFFGVAERVGSHMNDCFGLIGTPGFRLSPKTLLSLASLSGIDFFCLNESQKTYGLTGSITDQGWLIDLSAGPEDFFADLYARNREFCKKTKRRQRKLIESYGPLRLKCPREQSEMLHKLNRLIQCKSEQYQRTGVQDTFKTKWKKELLLELSKEESEGCSGVLVVLYAGDTWVASYYGLKCYSRLHGWFPVYNTKLSKFAPGLLLLWELIKHSRDMGILIIDRGVGNTEAKRLLGNLSSKYYRDVWFRPSLRGLLYRIGMSIKWRLKR